MLSCRMYAKTAAAGVRMPAGDLLALSIDLLKVISGDVDAGCVQQGLGCHVGGKSTKKRSIRTFWS